MRRPLSLLSRWRLSWWRPWWRKRGDEVPCDLCEAEKQAAVIRERVARLERMRDAATRGRP